MAEQSVTLQPGESTPVVFEAIPREAKLYHVSVDGLTGSFRAIAVAATANVWGVVRDAGTGSPIEGAYVVITTPTEPYKLVSDTYTSADGVYRIEGLEPGDYRMVVSATGYGVLTHNITLSLGDTFLGFNMAPPLPSVSVDFRRERACMTSRGDECLEYSPDERTGFITITNGDVPGNFTTTVEGWLYLEGAQYGAISGTNREWTDYFDAGQERTYSFGYMVPISGAPLDSRFFIKVYDPDSEIIADKVFITSL